MKLRSAMFWAIAAIGAALSLSAPASAASAQERREACSKEWQAAKDAGKVAQGETWSKFYSECNTRLKEAEDKAAPAAAKPAEKTTTEKKTSTDKKASEPKAAAEPAAGSRESRMKQCSEEWKVAKEAGKVPAGQTWPKFYSECNARLSGAAPAAAPAAATTAKPAAAPAAKPAAAPAATTAASGKSRQQQCSEEWKAAKEAGKIAEGETWPKFYSECNARLSGTAPAAAPAASTAAKTSAKTTAKDDDDVEVTAEPPTEVKTTDKNGKPFTPGQMAAHERMRDCGAEWRTAKDAGKIPAGQTWPQYWSACNTRLKAAGK